MLSALVVSKATKAERRDERNQKGTKRTQRRKDLKDTKQFNAISGTSRVRSRVPQAMPSMLTGRADRTDIEPYGMYACDFSSSFAVSGRQL